MHKTCGSINTLHNNNRCRTLNLPRPYITSFTDLVWLLLSIFLYTPFQHGNHSTIQTNSSVCFCSLRVEARATCIKTDKLQTLVRLVELSNPLFYICFTTAANGEIKFKIVKHLDAVHTFWFSRSTKHTAGPTSVQLVAQDQKYRKMLVYVLCR